jgi:hypothetical protein
MSHRQALVLLDSIVVVQRVADLVVNPDGPKTVIHAINRLFATLNMKGSGMSRAKFLCQTVTHFAHNKDSRRYTFQAVTDTRTPENASFTKYTPSGTVEILVDNPAVSFTGGKNYYLDFTEAPDSE